MVKRSKSYVGMVAVGSVPGIICWAWFVSDTHAFFVRAVQPPMQLGLLGRVCSLEIVPARSIIFGGILVFNNSEVCVGSCGLLGCVHGV